MVHQEHAQVCQIVNIQELAQRRTVAPTGHILRSAFLRLVETADQRRKNVAVCGMIVVVRSIEIRRHDADVIRTVLSVQKLAVFQSRDLCQRVCFVCFFQLACQQAAFFHGLRRHSRINAGRSEELQLLAAVFPRGMNHVHLEDHVVVHEIRKRVLVGYDSAYLRGCQKYVFGFFLREKRFYVILSAKIKLLVCACDDVGVALSLKLTHDRRANHSPVTCYIYFCVFFHHSNTSSFTVNKAFRQPQPRSHQTRRSFRQAYPIF